jgi:uncharacterized membrane protein SpoIIM required for sporulation
MVLENIVSIRDAVSKPWWMFFIGGGVSLVSLLVAYLVFPSSIGLFTVFLITIAMTPFMVRLMKYAESREEDLIKRHMQSGTSFLERQKDTILIFSAFFGGMIAFMSLAFILLPDSIVESVFEDQIEQINLIRGSFLGGTFEKILFNNVGVLFIAFIFSFLFGAGAVFILAWNASVLAAAIGIAAKKLGGIEGLPVATLIFFPHGSLEILAYFIGGIAGGIISAVLVRRSQMFPIILKDSLYLLATAAAILVAAGLIETFLISLS